MHSTRVLSAMISMLFAPLNRLIVKICSVVWGTVLLWGLGCACAYAQDVVCTRHAVCSLECSCVHLSFPLHNSHAVPCAYVCTRVHVCVREDVGDGVGDEVGVGVGLGVAAEGQGQIELCSGVRSFVRVFA